MHHLVKSFVFSKLTQPCMLYLDTLIISAKQVKQQSSLVYIQLAGQLGSCQWYVLQLPAQLLGHQAAAVARFKDLMQQLRQQRHQHLGEQLLVQASWLFDDQATFPGWRTD